MTKLTLIIAGAIYFVTSSMALANTLYGSMADSQAHASTNHFTALNAQEYQQTVHNSRNKVRQLLQELTDYRDLSQPLNAEVAFIAQRMANIPYMGTGAAGEGDWQPGSLTYSPGAVHIQQDPVYRLDGLECQTFVEVAMALLHAHNINEFDQRFVQISYGAAGSPADDFIHYYNRNNFIDGDFNPVNHRAGFLHDSTTNELAAFAKTQTGILTRQNWFNLQINFPENVRVLASQDAAAMTQRFTTLYTKLNFPNFATENIVITYLPKQSLALKQAGGSYLPNQTLLAQIPVPAVVEVIRDPAKWMMDGKTIKEAIGSELTVSHMGLLYRQTFAKGEIIFQDIKCHLNAGSKRICIVTPQRCQEASCNELMLAHATERHPNKYYWVAQANGAYTCSDQPPPAGSPKLFCNRVESVPLVSYLTDYQYGAYRYMDNPSILGVHIEKLL